MCICIKNTKMASVERRLQMKREPLDKWSTREQLFLASAVARSGDQNWMSVCRALKPFGEPNRPADWFHQKNCAAQYGALLANVETPKRKKRNSGMEYGIETPSETILRQLKAARLAELKKLLAEEKAEYEAIQDNLAVLNSGNFTEEQLDKWCKQIELEELKKEQEMNRYAQWLKEREARKMEIERQWRPTKVSASPIAKPIIEPDQSSNSNQTSEESVSPVISSEFSPKPPTLALSPLLTSLLKSPSQVQNFEHSSILHSAITNQRNTIQDTNSLNDTRNRMLNNLLANSTVNTPTSQTNLISTGLQQVVNTVTYQQQENLNSSGIVITPEDITAAASDILVDDEKLQDLKIEDIDSTLVVPDGPLPEIKNDVDVIISDLIADPEQHLQLDGNGDININLELDDLDDVDEQVVETSNEVSDQVDKQPQEISAVSEEPLNDILELNESVKKEVPVEVYNIKSPAKEKSEPVVIDPFEFQEEPEEIQPKLQPKLIKSTESPMKSSLNSSTTLQDSTVPEIKIEQDDDMEIETNDNILEESNNEETASKETDNMAQFINGSVEIVEVSTEEEEIGKVLDKSQIQNIVHSVKTEEEKEETMENVSLDIKDNEENKDVLEEKVDKIKEEIEPIKEPINEEKDLETKEDNAKEEIKPCISAEDIKEEPQNLEPNFTEELYDDITMEVNVSKAKRDYSRTKKKEEKEFDILLALEKQQLEDNELVNEFSTDKEFSEKKDNEEIKIEHETSSSPWTEEEDTLKTRRFSTPIDSVPNSPCSYYDDDKEYRNWKKTIMLAYGRLAAHKYSSLFLKPITEEQAPGYSSLVYRPMDLQTIRKNIESGVIKTTQEFQRDVMLMLHNAIMYNKTNCTVFNMTRELQQEAIESIQLMLQAQQGADAPARRETRTSEPGNKRKRGVEESTKNKKRKDE